MNSVIVTGVAGYIGGQTAIKLHANGYQVIGIDRRPLESSTVKDCLSKFLFADFASDEALDLIECLEPKAIIHCAGTSLVGPSVKDPMPYWGNNVYKNMILLNRIVSKQLTTRLIYSSSAAVYGNPIMVPCQEVDPCEPISPYGHSKLSTEWMLSGYNTAYNLDYVVLRYFNAAGADPEARHGQESNATHIIARVLESIKDNTKFICNGNNYETPDGTCVRDYVHVDDLAQAHMMAIDSKVPSGVYNLGTKTGTSNLEIVKLAEKITGRKVDLYYGPIRDGDPAMLTADADKFENASGWTTKYTTEDIIQHAWNWYNK